MSTQNFEWVKRRKELLGNIKKFELKGDRLEKTTQINYMHNAMHESIIGFSGWLNGWVAIELTKKIKIEEEQVPSLTDKELEELFCKFKDLSVKLIELDIEITDTISKKIKKKKLPAIFSKPNDQKTCMPMVV